VRASRLNQVMGWFRHLAQYEVEKGARSVSDAGSRRIGSESHWISGWDGSGRYLATWQVVDNDVDASSVCLNYRQGSMEYRNCRKAAKQWFKNQCREGRNAEAARQRYCSAASSFTRWAKAIKLATASQIDRSVSSSPALSAVRAPCQQAKCSWRAVT
jgi:hypothetical protein